MLSVLNLVVGYGREPVLKGIDLRDLAPGCVTALVGPNAAGKSTLLKAVAGLLALRGGAVTLGGETLSALGAAARARRVRFVPQAYATQARLTVYDLLVVARMCGAGGAPQRADLSAVDAALERTGTGALADRFVNMLSGGQQQLVALAQALTRPAPVLLLDEPTSALDLRNQLETMAVMRRVAAEDDAIVIAALHDLNLAARHADRVVLMSEGRVAADGAPADVLSDGACGRAYGVELETGFTARGSLLIEAYLPASRAQGPAIP